MTHPFKLTALLAAALGILNTPASAQDRPVFEVAAIKPSSPDSRLQVQFAPGGRLRVTHATLRFLIKIAYDLGDDQITGGPGWIASNRFDIDAKPETTADDASSHEQVKRRLQSLLEDRFQLKLRSESKQFPVFALVISKNGPKLQPATLKEGERFGMQGGRGQLTATKMDMAMFAKVLSENSGRTVLDKTGLQGAFNFKLEWTPDTNSASAPDSDARPIDLPGPSLFTALQEQLGLKLEPQKGPAPVVIVEHAEPPTEN